MYQQLDLRAHGVGQGRVPPDEEAKHVCGVLRSTNGTHAAATRSRWLSRWSAVKLTWWIAHIGCAKLRGRAQNLDWVAPEVREAKELEAAAGATHPAPTPQVPLRSAGVCGAEN